MIMISRASISQCCESPKKLEMTSMRTGRAGVHPTSERLRHRRSQGLLAEIGCTAGGTYAVASGNVIAVCP